MHHRLAHPRAYIDTFDRHFHPPGWVIIPLGHPEPGPVRIKPARAMIGKREMTARIAWGAGDEAGRPNTAGPSDPALFLKPEFLAGALDLGPIRRCAPSIDRGLEPRRHPLGVKRKSKLPGET
jgi:hypothetical protein